MLDFWAVFAMVDYSVLCPNSLILDSLKPHCSHFPSSCCQPFFLFSGGPFSSPWPFKSSPPGSVLGSLLFLLYPVLRRLHPRPWLHMITCCRWLRYPAQTPPWIPNLHLQLLCFSLLCPLLTETPKFVIPQTHLSLVLLNGSPFPENSVSQSRNLAIIFEALCGLASPPCLSEYNAQSHDFLLFPEYVLFFYVSHYQLMEAAIVACLNSCTSYLIGLIFILGPSNPGFSFQKNHSENPTILPPPAYHPSVGFWVCKPPYKDNEALQGVMPSTSQFRLPLLSPPHTGYL